MINENETIDSLILDSCSQMLSIRDAHSYKLLQVLKTKEEIDTAFQESTYDIIVKARVDSIKAEEVIDIVIALSNSIKDFVVQELRLAIRDRLTGIEEFKDDISITLVDDDKSIKTSVIIEYVSNDNPYKSPNKSVSVKNELCYFYTQKQINTTLNNLSKSLIQKINKMNGC